MESLERLADTLALARLACTTFNSKDLTETEYTETNRKIEKIISAITDFNCHIAQKIMEIHQDKKLTPSCCMSEHQIALEDEPF